MTTAAPPTPPTTHYRTCSLSEAACGVAVTVEGLGVRAAAADPFSRGLAPATRPR